MSKEALLLDVLSTAMTVPVKPKGSIATHKQNSKRMSAKPFSLD